MTRRSARAPRTCCASWRRRSSVPLVRRYGDFADAEDAVQEALLAAAATWPAEGQPDNPLGWLVRVASRRLADQLPRRRGPPPPRGTGRLVVAARRRSRRPGGTTR